MTNDYKHPNAYNTFGVFNSIMNSYITIYDRNRSYMNVIHAKTFQNDLEVYFENNPVLRYFKSPKVADFLIGCALIKNNK
jgi:hypothetical protein